MSLWGKRDLVYSDGTVNVNLGTKQVTGGVGVVTFTDNNVTVGDVINVGSASSVGYAVIIGITSTTLSIASTEGFISGVTTFSGESYEITECPSYTVVDPHYEAPESKTTGFSTSNFTTQVVGVAITEQSVANAATGGTLARKLAPPHAGWVGVTTYIDCHGELRVKTETLVAMSSIHGDNDDDALYPDSDNMV